MEKISEERRLFREAADLAIRLQNDPENQVAIDMVKAWIARSASHEAAWSKVSVIHGMTGKVLFERQKADARGRSLMTRRNLIAGGLVGFGLGGSGAIMLPGIVMEARADHMTEVAEMRDISLPDGSTVRLGPKSAIALNFRNGSRGVNLLAGMAYFDVLNNSSRPFVVECGPLKAISAGAAFDLTSDAGVLSMSVDRDEITVEASGLGPSGMSTLRMGEWLSFDPATGDVVRATREETQIAVWRNGMIIAERETVSALVARIGRWQKGKVVVADPWLGSRVVSGVFDLSDPLRALSAVVRPYGAKVRDINGLMTVISPI